MSNKFNFEIKIRNKGIEYIPLVVEGATLTTNYRGVPAELNFTVVKTDNLNFVEGNSVTLVHNGVKMFDGFVFEKQRSDDFTISVKAYDRLRYFQCRDNIEFTDKPASKYIEYIAERVQMNSYSLEDTGYVLPGKVEESTSYIDMIMKALDTTKKLTGEEYVFYDDNGTLTLKNVKSLVTDCYIDANCMQSYSYTTSIDKDTYTQVRVVKSNGREKDEQEYVAIDEENKKRWGTLVYYEQMTDNENTVAKAKELLKQHSRKTVTLSLKDVFGRPEIRAGNSVYVNLALGDMNVSQHLLVTRCTHTFNHCEHFMQLDLKGGVINE